MGYLDFLILMSTETVKYFLISYGIVGMKLKKDYKRYLPILLLLLAIMFVAKTMRFDWFYLRVLYSFLIVILFFDERINRKIKIYIMENIPIGAIDLFLWSMLAIFIDSGINQEMNRILNWISEVLGCAFWFILVVLLKKTKVKIHHGIRNLPTGYFIVAFIFLAGMGLMIGIAHANVLGEMTEKMWKYFLTMGSVVLVLFIVLIFIFFYIVYSKKQLEKEKQFRDKYIVLQKTYYEKIMEDDKKLRGFRHDIAKHIQVLNALCRSDDIETLKDYITGLSGRYIEDAVFVNTGNLAADYFINMTISELRKSGGVNYEVIGKFPQSVNVSDVDFSILFGNALENAKEALKKVDGERKLKVSVMNYHGRIFINISNSVSGIGEINLKTTKMDAKNHGYGIKNMRDVVNRYGGKIDFKIEDGMFMVEIEV